jgi:adenylate cyclase
LFESIGVILGLLGILFAFEKPRRAFLAFFNRRSDVRPIAADEHPSLAADGSPKASGEKPSIAVLAFDNMSGDSAQGYFCDGISEDIITDLSKINGLAVIGRQSSFTYKGKASDVRRVGQELGVRYVLEGSVRKVGSRVRVSAQLIESETGTHVWANRYDREWDEAFLMGDEIAEDIVASLDIKVGRGEDARIWRKATRSPKARDVFYEGQDAYYIRRRKTTAGHASFSWK